MMKQLGFTLIELMVVTIIIAILAAIALPSYASYVRSAHEKAALQKLGDIALKLEKEKTRNFSYSAFSLDAEDTFVKRNKSSGDIIYNISIDTQPQTWVIVSCINDQLDNAALYKNYARNNKGKECQWQDTTCAIPADCF
ncbi:type IV pilin protein [Acinetobacter terrestris]|uniref:type IV pilin protein n=1 Tax=Acinetobacter terrestris TaxID=2529843 RepID=UPI001BE449BE|nr:prepilin-type N-terminal cleavage/methylation domain-containing protein [Acinetobacter terrestris]